MDLKGILPGVETVSDLTREIEHEFIKLGLFFRIFNRIKTYDSIEKKLKRGHYNECKKIQDLVGIRIVLYFNDDINLTCNILKTIFTIDNETVDLPENETFKPTRVNLVFKLKEEIVNLIDQKVFDNYLIDKTFEVQVRTVFSEGWHEIEHDLRYKKQEDWEGHNESSRILNGIVATLEGCDWSILQLIDDLAYKHYKSGKWEAMIRNKFRLKFQDEKINKELSDYFDSDNETAKKIFRFNRNKLLKKISLNEFKFPITLNNIVFFINLIEIENENILEMTPKLMKEKISL